jgi:hypothetical protein
MEKKKMEFNSLSLSLKHHKQQREPMYRSFSLLSLLSSPFSSGALLRPFFFFSLDWRGFVSRKVYYHETRDELFNNTRWMEKSLAAAAAKKQYCDTDTVSGGVSFSPFITYFFERLLSCFCTFSLFSRYGEIFSLSLSLSLKEEEVFRFYFCLQREKNPKPSLNLGFQKRGRGGAVCRLSLIRSRVHHHHHINARAS